MNERAAIEVAARRRLEHRVLGQFLDAAHLLGLVAGKVIADVRAMADPPAAQAATIIELRARLTAAERKVAILQRRLDRLPSRQRPHFDPASRFDVLEIRRLLGESAAATAEWCRVSVATVLRWEAELKQHPTRKTVGSLLRAIPPVRRFADAERRLVQWMDRMGFPGSGTIARTLARAGRKISTTAVRRIRKEKALPTPEPPSARLVEGRYPNHVWIADETEIPALFRIFSFKLLLVIDAFSRFPVAARLSVRSTTGNDVIEILGAAAKQHGQPRHLVTDKGRLLRSKRLAVALRRAGVQHRFGAVGQHGSIALVERLLKTLKYTFRLRHPFTMSRDAVERRLTTVLAYYAYLRPHESLHGAAPAEVYFGLAPAHRSATGHRAAGPGTSRSRLPSTSSTSTTRGPCPFSSPTQRSARRQPRVFGSRAAVCTLARLRCLTAGAAGLYSVAPRPTPIPPAIRPRRQFPLAAYNMARFTTGC